MNLQTDVFPLLKNNDLMIKSPTTTVGKNPSERFPDNEWIYTDDFSPSWRGQYPNSFIPRWDVNPLMEGELLAPFPRSDPNNTQVDPPSKL